MALKMKSTALGGVRIRSELNSILDQDISALRPQILEDAVRRMAIPSHQRPRASAYSSDLSSMRRSS